VLTLYADDDFKLSRLTDVLLTKCAKRAWTRGCSTLFEGGREIGTR